MTAAPLTGRTALITGASRRRGIGAAVARRLAVMGADDLEAVMADIRAHLLPGAVLHDVPGDMADPAVPERAVQAAIDAAGPLDILVANHARSGGDGTLAQVTSDMLDGHWAVDTRSVLLLTQVFAKRHDRARPGGRVIWMTSGQALGPMPGEVAYASAKAALAGVTLTVADELADQGILLNTVNPGPVNSGYLDNGLDFTDEDLDSARARFPSGRFGAPEDPARLIGWLVSDEGEWMVGQVLNTEGGFRRW